MEYDIDQEGIEEIMSIENIFLLESSLNDLTPASISVIIKHALKNQKIEMLDRIHCFEIYDNLILRSIDANSSLESFKWIFNNYPKSKLESIFHLVEKNKITDIDLIRTAKKNGFEPNIYFCALIAKENNILDVESWLNENGHQCDACVCAIAAYHGDLELLKWLRERECPWDSGTCESAIEGNHLQVLIWVRENHCPWNKYIYKMAKKKGNIEIIRWIKKNESFKEPKKLACIIF